MSFDDLDKFVKQLDTKPQDPIDPSSFDELAKQGRKMDGIVSQREVEIDYNSPEQDDFLQGGLLLDAPVDPSEVSVIDEDIEKLNAVTLSVQAATFTLDYPMRLMRSAMAVSGVSATTERFGDIRKSHSFWLAMVDLIHTASFQAGPNVPALEDIKSKGIEQIKKVPDVLTRIDAPGQTLPGIGRSLTNLGTPPELEWVYDLVGEIMFEGKAIGAISKAGKIGLSKFTKNTYDAGEEIAKKGGVKRLLGSFTDEEISALAEARKFKKVGLLGTKPPQNQIDDAVTNTFKYIEETADARLTKKKAISIKRKAGAARMYDVQGEGYGIGYSQRFKKAGAIKVTESSYVPFIEAVPGAADDLVTLQKTIDNFDFGGSKIYTTGDAQDALAKLYERGELLTAGDVEQLRDVFGDAFANSLGKFIDKPTGLLGKAFKVGSATLRGLSATSRTLMTTGELSFLLRQGNYRAWTRPADAIRSFAVASRSLISPKYAQYWDEAMRGSEKGRDAIQKGLFLGRFDDGVKLTAREEMFSAEFVKRVPVLGKAIERFEKGYVVGLNQIRIDWFDEGMDIIRRSGKEGDDELTGAWSNYVNNMTGRADLEGMIGKGLGPEADKIMQGMADTAKNVLFAPRFAASKWNKHKVAAELIFGEGTPAGLRRMIVGDTMIKWRRYERLAHYAVQNGYEIELNPSSSDFLKLKRKDTRFDVLGGDAQLLVLIARLATGETKDTATGEIKDNIATELIQSHAAGKLNPAISLLYDKFIAKETFMGEDLNDPEVLLRNIAGKFIPLYIQDVRDKIYNGYEEEGLTVAESIDGSTSTLMMGWVGAGIQTYPPSARKKIELLYNESAQKLFVKDWADLTLIEKQDAMFAAEMDHGEEIEELKLEANVNALSPGSAAKMQSARNRSVRAIRKGLGDDFMIFKDSMISPGSLSIDVESVRLSSDQHKRLNRSYVRFIKEELAKYPDLKKMDVADPNRRQWLQDIIDISRDSAKDELFFEQPVRYIKQE